MCYAMASVREPCEGSRHFIKNGCNKNTASALTAQSAFLNNIEDIINCRVNIQEDIKRYCLLHRHLLVEPRRPSEQSE